MYTENSSYYYLFKTEMIVDSLKFIQEYMKPVELIKLQDQRWMSKSFTLKKFLVSHFKFQIVSDYYGPIRVRFFFSKRELLQPAEKAKF